MIFGMQNSSRLREQKMDKLYTARELSRLLKVSQGTIWRWGREGELKTVRVGRLVRFEMPEIKERKYEVQKGRQGKS